MPEQHSLALTNRFWRLLFQSPWCRIRRLSISATCRLSRRQCIIRIPSSLRTSLVFCPSCQRIFNGKLRSSKKHPRCLPTLSRLPMAHLSTWRRKSLCRWVGKLSLFGCMVSIYPSTYNFLHVPLATPDIIHQTEFCLDITAQVLPLYERIFGIEYPLPKLDTLAVSCSLCSVKQVVQLAMSSRPTTLIWVQWRYFYTLFQPGPVH